LAGALATAGADVVASSKAAKGDVSLVWLAVGPAGHGEENEAAAVASGAILGTGTLLGAT
jgi:hypothetical protein